MRLAWITALVLAADQITKWLAVRQLLDQPAVELLPFLDLVLVYNTGAAFGFLNDAGGWQNAFFVAVAVVVCAVIAVMLRRLGGRDPQARLALWLILSGAIGNVIDRVRQGYVVDFVHVHYRAFDFPAFNVADSAITIGAALLILDSLGWSLVGRKAGEANRAR